jgi:membrane protease YdiL (CAAX protease family)
MEQRTSHYDGEGRSSTKSVAVDLALVLGTLFVLKWTLLQFSATWTFAGPVSELVSLGVAHRLLKRKKETWKSLGLAHTTNWWNVALWVVIAFVVTTALGSVASSLANSVLTTQDSAGQQARQFMSGRFSDMPGNVPVYIYWLITSWIIGGFTEEMLFRGFLISKFERLFGKTPFAIPFAIVLPALIFGQQHMYYQGIKGLVEGFVIATLYGTIYIVNKRRLWPLIICHGLVDTVGMTMIFLSAPGAG